MRKFDCMRHDASYDLTDTMKERRKRVLLLSRRQNKENDGFKIYLVEGNKHELQYIQIPLVLLVVSAISFLG